MFVFPTDAPKAWVYQTWIYVGLMVIVKLITTLALQLRFWDNVKDLVLYPFANPHIKVTAVMLVIPFFVNVSVISEIQLYYVINYFLLCDNWLRDNLIIYFKRFFFVFGT